MTTGWPSAVNSFAPVSRSRRWIPSRDSKNAIAWPAPRTQPACSMPFTLSISLVTLSMRYVAASSKTRPVTVGARAIPSTKSGFFCAPHTRRLTPRQQERFCEAFAADEAHISVEVAYHCAQQVREVFHQATPHPPKADAWPHTSSSAYQRVPSPKSLAWAGLYANGRTHSTPTATQPEPATRRTEAINGHYRTRQTNRQRLPQPHQLPTPNAPHCRRPRCLHPHPTTKSRIWCAAVLTTAQHRCPHCFRAECCCRPGAVVPSRRDRRSP